MKSADLRHTHSKKFLPIRGMRALLCVLALVFFCVSLAGCAPLCESTVYAMGTVCNLRVWGDGDLIKKGEQILLDSDQLYSWRRPDSEISRINSSSGEWVSVSKETFALIRTALEWAERTEGAFDPTVGVLSQEWDFSGDPHCPDEETLANLLPLVGYGQVELDESACAVRLAKGQKLDLGAVAKGYSGQQLFDLYQTENAERALINLGGNVCALGDSPKGREWTVGVRDPLGETGSYYCTLSVRDAHVVISGPYERWFEEKGIRYHHILDPATGMPADSGLLSVCVVSQDGTVADILSTAIFVAGPEKGLQFAQDAGVDVMLVCEEDCSILCTPGFAEKYQVMLKDGVEYEWKS